MSSQCTLSLPPVFSGDRGALGKNGLIGSWKWSEVSPFVNPFQVDAVSNGLISSVINQKGESQNGCFKKIKHAKFSEKRTFLTLWYAYVPVRISEILACFIFLKHPFPDSPFCLIIDDIYLKKAIFNASKIRGAHENFDEKCFHGRKFKWREALLFSWLAEKNPQYSFKTDELNVNAPSKLKNSSEKPYVFFVSKKYWMDK